MKVKIDPLLVNQILSSIIEGMRAGRHDEIRLAAVRALNNSLGFTDTNFENPDERNAIMSSICEATQAKNVKIRECAYECCATVGEFYYDKIEPYVKTLYEFTMNAIRTDEPSVGMQAIEFWNTIADEETKIMEEIDEALKTRDNLLNITQQAAPSLIPVILECMTKQDEDSEDDDSWDISKAGATLLESISKVQSHFLNLSFDVAVCVCACAQCGNTAHWNNSSTNFNDTVQRSMLLLAWSVILPICCAVCCNTMQRH